ncbi:chloride channel protein [Natroniella acetigena]|uniref:chloride channel protein n=1 Tax=Natroniella acetigena TaxID=52004 RepID=UPI00200B2406|nr:chloride channel protein [Natroniella acetigena]MCK8827921.1 chloride channel protein [Natroniella acetigena]
MKSLSNNNFLDDIVSSVKYIVKWTLLSVLVGIVVGFAAVIFTGSLNWGIELLSGVFATRWVYIMPIIGLFLSGFLTSTFAPEAAGHGTDAIIESYNQDWGKVDIIVVPVKLIASVFTIAFGGSAGREGPTVQMGGGLGYFIGKNLNLKLTDIQKIVICGMAASFGAIFTAPIAGGMFGAEVLYMDDAEYKNLFIGFISSITAYYIHAVVLNKPSLFTFPIPQDYVFNPQQDILFFVAVGVFTGLVSLLFIKSLYGYEHLNEEIRLPDYYKTALGGALTGLTAVIITPQVLGTGISLIEEITVNSNFGVGLIFLLMIGKILATSFTIGSGGSGGVVAPALTIGALGGAFLANILNYPHPFALVSAVAVGVLGSAAHIPVTTTLLAAELFGIELIKPATIVCFIGAWIARSDTLYRETYVSKTEKSKAAHSFTRDEIE